MARRLSPASSSPTPNHGAAAASQAAQACQLTFPIVFLIMARSTIPSIKAYPHRSDPRRWCFRFGRGCVAEIDDQGEVFWRKAKTETRRDVTRVIEHARLQFRTVVAASR
jgi:hypothetical protein